MSDWTRVDGMIEGLAGLIVNVVQQHPTDCDQVKGDAAAEAILAAYPDVKAIGGACDPPIIGGLEAIENAGIDPSAITVGGFDASPAEMAPTKPGPRMPAWRSSRSRWASWASRPPGMPSRARPWSRTWTPAPPWSPRTTPPSSSSRRQRGVPGVSSPGTPSTLATKATRIAQLRATGYPAYTTSSGWLGRPDEKVRRLARSLSGARA